MSGNKLAYMKSTRQNLREAVSYRNNISMNRFTDRHRDIEKKGIAVPFKNSWALLAHMQDLRLWTITYAPSKMNNLQRM